MSSVREEEYRAIIKTLQGQLAEKTAELSQETRNNLEKTLTLQDKLDTALKENVDFRVQLMEMESKLGKMQLKPEAVQDKPASMESKLGNMQIEARSQQTMNAAKNAKQDMGGVPDRHKKTYELPNPADQRIKSTILGIERDIEMDHIFGVLGISESVIKDLKCKDVLRSPEHFLALRTNKLKKTARRHGAREEDVRLLLAFQNWMLENRGKLPKSLEEWQAVRIHHVRSHVTPPRSLKEKLFFCTISCQKGTKDKTTVATTAQATTAKATTSRATQTSPGLTRNIKPRVKKPLLLPIVPDHSQDERGSGIDLPPSEHEDSEDEYGRGSEHDSGSGSGSGASELASECGGAACSPENTPERE